MGEGIVDHRRFLGAEFLGEFDRFVDRDRGGGASGGHFVVGHSQEVSIDDGLTMDGPFGRERGDRGVGFLAMLPGCLRQRETFIVRLRTARRSVQGLADDFRRIGARGIELIQALQGAFSDVSERCHGQLDSSSAQRA